jgi:predicted kinase
VAEVRVVAVLVGLQASGKSTFARRLAARGDSARVPEAGLRATLARLRRPTTDDGFQAVLTVTFDGAGGFDVREAAGEEVGRWAP